jgi:hypothetical protein
VSIKRIVRTLVGFTLLGIVVGLAVAGIMIMLNTAFPALVFNFIGQPKDPVKMILTIGLSDGATFGFILGIVALIFDLIAG